MKDKLKINKAFQKYIPEEYCDYVVELFYAAPVHFKVSKPRKTKLGDYRCPRTEHDVHRISVNANLNKYAFLITTLHEFAHMNTFIKHGNKVAPHGIEWKTEFKKLLQPLLGSESFPTSLKQVLSKNIQHIKASSYSDLPLLRALKKFDINTEKVYLEQLPNHTCFVLNGKRFQRGELRRTRFLCTELITKKQYLVHRMAEVELLEKNEE